MAFRSGAVLFLAALSVCRATSLVDLPVPPGEDAYYTSGALLNNSGQVALAGWANNTSLLQYQQQDFLYSQGAYTNLGQLPGLTQTTAYATPVGLNDLGQVLSSTITQNGNAIVYSLYSNGVKTDLGPGIEAALGVSSTSLVNPAGLNNAGQTALTLNGEGYVYNVNSQTAIAVPDVTGQQSVTMLGITNSGLAYGWTGTAAGSVDTIIYNTATATTTLLTGLGGYTLSFQVNDQGDAVGMEYSPDFSTLIDYYYSNRQYTDLDSLLGPDDSYATATALNDLGQAVGDTTNVFTQTSVGFLYENGQIELLNDAYSSLLTTEQGAPGFVSLDQAFEINNSGQILGEGTYWTGQSEEDRLFLLSTVPDPASTLTLLLAFGALAWTSRRWRDVRQ